jgi:hypothetical protein
MDAAVASLFGLSREQYLHVLSTFNHKSYPDAPTRCLLKFDELSAIGKDSFTKKYDPYWDIAPNEALPSPVVEVPGLRDTDGTGGEFTLSSPAAAPKKG